MCVVTCCGCFFFAKATGRSISDCDTKCFLAYRRIWLCVSQELAADLSRQQNSINRSSKHRASRRLLNYQQQHNQATDNNNTLYSSKLLSFISCSVEMNQQHATLNNNEHGGRLALRVSSCYYFCDSPTWRVESCSFCLIHSPSCSYYSLLCLIGCLKPTCCRKCVQQGWWKTQQSQ